MNTRELSDGIRSNHRSVKSAALTKSKTDHNKIGMHYTCYGSPVTDDERLYMDSTMVSRPLYPRDSSSK